MSENKLIRRLWQIRAGIEATVWPAPTTIGVRPTAIGSDEILVSNLNEGVANDTLDLQISAILASIGSMKDYLDDWCEMTSRPKMGDAVINSNRDVALVHDLWNVDKHARLKRKPRSGFVPHLRDVSRILEISESEAGGGAYLAVNPYTGEVSTHGNAEMVLFAIIADEDENYVDDFRAVCNRAIDIWVSAMKDAGVPLHHF